MVGGGIVGAGIAALAAELGLDVALVDRADFASATSSASSKLIHGGLRYLRIGDVRLIREALRESEALSGRIAPHLVHRSRFLLPVYEGGPYGRAAVRTALGTYRVLSGSKTANAFIPGDLAASLVPSFKLAGLRGVGIYGDAQTDDARLCLANVRAAEDGGAAIANYAEVVSIESGARGSTRVEVIDGTPVVLSKGVHLVLEAPPGWHAGVTIPIDTSRVSFALPWEGTLLLGTTDEVYWDDPDDVSVTEADEAQVLGEAGLALDAEILGRERISRDLPA